MMGSQGLVKERQPWSIMGFRGRFVNFPANTNRIPIAFAMFVATLLLWLCPSYGGIINETFDNNKFNQSLFYISIEGAPTAVVATNRLEVTIPASSTGKQFCGYLNSKFVLSGDFDVQVDFNLLTWPIPNGVGAGLNLILYTNPLTFCEVSRRSFGPGQEVYEAWFDIHPQFQVNTSDSSGRVRVTRTGNKLEAFYWQNGWQSFGSRTDPQYGLVAAEVYTGVFSFDGYFFGKDVKAALDNYQIIYDRKIMYGGTIAPILPLLLGD